jgi:Enterobacterial TraT complement resistance protein
MKSSLFLTLLLGLPFLAGCAATEVALEHKNLDVQTRMSASIFLDVEQNQTNTIFLQVRNTSDKDINLEPLLKQKLQAEGYTILNSPQNAFYILQVNVRYVGKTSPSALHDSLYAGWGGPMAGLSTGAAIGAATGGINGLGYGGAIGGLVGGAGELVAGSLVKNVTYAMITDVQIMEKTDEAVKQEVQSHLTEGTGTTVGQSSESVRNRRKYQTRVASSANQVNLKFAEARPVLEEKLAASIAGIF